MAKILVVDDSRFSRGLTTATMQAGGHEVVEAVNGLVGLEMVQAHQPDCVILDMLMPVLDGPGFLARLRQGGSTLPVLVLTADIQATTRAQVEALGISGFLNKPLKAEEALRLVDEALAKSRGGALCS